MVAAAMWRLARRKPMGPSGRVGGVCVVLVVMVDRGRQSLRFLVPGGVAGVRVDMSLSGSWVPVKACCAYRL